MLLRDYPIMIGIASLFALPASWYYSRHWLESFAVKTSINSWIYIISVILVLMLCLGTVLLQTLKTAGTNPADVLRHE
jgi:putative ABC transport system permease protein